MIFILTGAGISKESGLETFRDADGLWAKERVEDVATPGAFVRDPQRVYNFYNKRRRQLTGGDIKPNAAHLALARLEAEYSPEVLVVTQNVDDLHERAGSRNLWHMHGELLKARCQGCGLVFEWREDLGVEDICPGCRRPGLMRPHIVWFEEMPLYLPEIGRTLEKADIFVSIGTSGDVYPAAGFVREARTQGVKTVELNLEPSRNAWSFDEALYGPATKVVTEWVDSLLAAK